MEQDPPRTPQDARRLPADALEELRRQAVAAVESGTSQMEVALILGVSRRSVGEWVRAYRRRGDASFRPTPRGRRPGEQLALSAAHQARVVRLLVRDPPDRLDLPYLMWSRRAVTELIHREFGITLSSTTVGRYLQRWGIDVADPDRDPPPGRDTPAHPGGPHAEQLRVSWVPIVSPEGGPAHVLRALTSSDILLFLARKQPFDTTSLVDTRTRLRLQLGRDLRTEVDAWPDAHSDLRHILTRRSDV